mgnify:CR=1 FL=1
MHSRRFGRYAEPQGKANYRQDHYPKQEDFYRKIEASLTQCRRGSFEKAILPRCDSGNRVGLSGHGEKRLGGSLSVSDDIADGWIVENPREAVVMFPADCPVVAIHDRLRNRLAVLHAGYQSIARDCSILAVPFREHKFPPAHVRVDVVSGIGSCCYGVEHYPEVKRFPYARAVRGPREGQRSLDLSEIIRAQLVTFGVSLRRIKTSTFCTACATNDAGD